METTAKINTPLVSILMLTYNRAHFLPAAVESVLSQTYPNWELFIIDDGSTDETPQTVSRYDDGRIKFIHHEKNGGLFARRKESLSYATGEYVAILDSDDYWPDPNKIAKQVEHMVNNPNCAVVGTQTILVDKDGKKLSNYLVCTDDKSIRNRILIQNQFVHSSLLLRKTMLEKTLGYQPTLAEDLELVLQLGVHGTFNNLDSLSTAHRVHGDSQNDHGPKMAEAVVNIIKTHGRNYPFPLLAKIFSQLRLFKARLQ